MELMTNGFYVLTDAEIRIMAVIEAKENVNMIPQIETAIRDNNQDEGFETSITEVTDGGNFGFSITCDNIEDGEETIREYFLIPVTKY
jgi:hypothetical protein